MFTTITKSIIPSPTTTTAAALFFSTNINLIHRRSLHVLKTISEVRSIRQRDILTSTSVGLVPTMGSLHEGHLKLVDQARKNNKQAWVSIFVNPSQFAPHEDFSKYPRNLEKDLAMLKSRGVDYVFAPEPSEMYPGIKPNQTSNNVQRTLVVPVGVEQDQAEGKTRPGHFVGVATVVTKLFNIVQPTNAYFGQKDGLQCIVIRQIVRELNMPYQVVICPTEREPDLLAMSSRNVYLSPTQRKIAPVLYDALSKMKKAFDQGERDYEKLKNIVKSRLEEVAQSQPASPTADGKPVLPSFKIDYISIVDTNSGIEEKPGKVSNQIMCSSAIHFGNCRILDNVLCSS
jgi:pantoate--beta-alanine ligase